MPWFSVSAGRPLLAPSGHISAFSTCSVPWETDSHKLPQWTPAPFNFHTGSASGALAGGQRVGQEESLLFTSTIPFLPGSHLLDAPSFNAHSFCPQPSLGLVSPPCHCPFRPRVVRSSQVATLEALHCPLFCLTLQIVLKLFKLRSWSVASVSFQTPTYSLFHSSTSVGKSSTKQTTSPQEISTRNSGKS